MPPLSFVRPHVSARAIPADTRSRLLEVMVCCRRIADTAIVHNDKGDAIGERPKPYQPCPVKRKARSNRACSAATISLEASDLNLSTKFVEHLDFRALGQVTWSSKTTEPFLILPL